MEWAVWVTSSDSEDDLTPEKDEESAPSNSSHQCPLNDLAQESCISDAQGSMDLASVNTAAVNSNVWDSLKAKAGKKPPPKDIQGLIQFRSKDGSMVPDPHAMSSTLTTSVSEEAGVSYKGSEDLTMPTMSEEEQKLVTEEDLGEPAEEIQCNILTAGLTCAEGLESVNREGGMETEQEITGLTFARGLESVNREGGRETEQEIAVTGIHGLNPESVSGKGSVPDEPLATWCPLMGSLVAASLLPKTAKGTVPVVWLVGHSFIRRARDLVISEQDLLPEGARFLWFGKDGMLIGAVMNLITFLLRVQQLPPPDVVVLHVGGNDLVRLGRQGLRLVIMETLNSLMSLLPQAQLLWSEMIPRRVWVKGTPPASRNGSTRKINSNVRALALVSPRLHVVCHPLIHDPPNFHEDGVHLSVRGSRIFVRAIVAEVCAALSSVGPACRGRVESPVGPLNPVAR